MKIEVGKKYRMRNYHAKYKHVKIIGSKNEYDDEVFFGNIVVKNVLGLEIRSNLCEWGATGNWDNGEGIDDNDLIGEVKDVD